MSDIVERLKQLDDWMAGGSGTWPVVLDAADEIERLRGEVERQRIVVENVRQFVTYAGAGMSDPTVYWAASEVCKAFDAYAEATERPVNAATPRPTPGRRADGAL